MPNNQNISYQETKNIKEFYTFKVRHEKPLKYKINFTAGEFCCIARNIICSLKFYIYMTIITSIFNHFETHSFKPRTRMNLLQFTKWVFIIII